MIGHRRFRSFYFGCIVSSGPVVRGVRSLPTRLTNVVLTNLLRVVRFLGRAVDGFSPNL